ncbi:MAG TPA: hypothetical protein VEP72_08875 [Microbacterium sp.]|nr:hypothetical protein [Microbacterium sp.]
MAGFGHGSVTGLDERTLGRIDLLLFDADYAASADAVEDSWRVAVLAADPRARDARERARAQAVHAANARRDPVSARVRGASTRHRLCLGVALVLAVVATGLVMPSQAGSLQATMLPAGFAAAAAVALLWWLEPRRANGSLWGSRAPAGLHLACGAMWLLAAGVALVARWGEIDAQRPLPVTTGLVILLVAAVLALLLWRRALRADRSGRQSGMARVTGDLADARDATAVFFALDRWWQGAGPAAMAAHGARVRRVRVEVLARLRLAGVVSEIDEQFANIDPSPIRWRERRR